MRTPNSLSLTIVRMAAFLSSVLYAFILNGHNTLSDQLSQIIVAQDFENGQKLVEAITPDDLKQLADSALFDYHYLVAYYNSETFLGKANTNKVIEHLSAAKQLREKSLGIHCRVYVEIMDALASAYTDIGQYDEALAIYQEGIVKSSYERTIATHEFSELYLGLMGCYEYFGWFEEIPKLLRTSWEFADKENDDILYSYFPLWTLRKYYYRYEMYDNALSVSDEIEDFIISKEGANSPELSSELYFRGAILCDMGKNTDAISVYERALSIALLKRDHDTENIERIYGNLMLAYADEGLFDKCIERLPEIRNYEKPIVYPHFYETIIYNCASHLNQANHCDEALQILNMINPEEISDEGVYPFEDLRKKIAYRQRVLSQVEQIKTSRSAASPGSDEWFKLSFELSDFYLVKDNSSDRLAILYEMYEEYLKNPDNPSAYPTSIIEYAMDASHKLQQYSTYLDFAIAKNNLLHKLSSQNPMLNDTQKENMREQLINNLNEIVVGQLKCNQLDGIDEKFQKIEAFWRNKYGIDSQKYATYLHNRGRAYQLQNKLEDAKAALLQSIQTQKHYLRTISANTVKYYNEVVEALGEL